MVVSISSDVQMLQASEALNPHVIPENKVHGANMGPTWVLSAPDGPHAGPMSLAIRDHRPSSTTAADGNRVTKGPWTLLHS